MARMGGAPSYSGDLGGPGTFNELASIQQTQMFNQVPLSSGGEAGGTFDNVDPLDMAHKSGEYKPKARPFTGVRREDPIA